MPHLVFVYGTLRKGFCNHHFLRRAKFLGRARTKEKYALYVGEFPYVVKNRPVSFIVGEVYAVDNAALAALDELEGHPNCYKREKIKVRLEDGQEVGAWIYFYPRPRGKLIRKGDFAAHQGYY